jgi:hypothetical protein
MLYEAYDRISHTGSFSAPKTPGRKPHPGISPEPKPGPELTTATFLSISDCQFEGCFLTRHGPEIPENEKANLGRVG